MKYFSRRNFLLALFSSGFATTLYSRFLEPSWLDITFQEIRLSTRSLNKSLLLLHLSDFHLSDDVPLKYIEEAIDRAISYKPELICITGDFITSRLKNFSQYKRVLSKLSSAAPAYACLGNHDGGSWAMRVIGYSEKDKVLKLLDESGITCLNNSEVPVTIKGLNFSIAGLGDFWSKEMDPEKALNYYENINLPRIILLHNPDGKKKLLQHRWDIMLCGHTHGGQLKIPFIGTPFAPVRDKRFIEGLHKWHDRQIYITRGVGNLYGLRFNCRPQVSFLKLL